MLKLIPKSVNNEQRTYEVPDERQANINISIILVDTLNRSEAFKSNANIQPTWNPIHIGHLNSSPHNPCFGLIQSKIEP